MAFRSLLLLTFLIGTGICNRTIAADLGPGEAAARFNAPDSGVRSQTRACRLQGPGLVSANRPAGDLQLPGL